MTMTMRQSGLSKIAAAGNGMLPVAAAAVLALGLRLLYIYQLTATPLFHELALDSDYYQEFARAILHGAGGRPEAILLNIFYPFFLAAVYSVFGTGTLAVLLIQAALDTLSCLLIYYIAAAAFNRAAGILAAFLYAVYGIAVFFTGLVLDTTVATFLGLLFLALVTAGMAGRKPAACALAAGIVFGLLTLARPAQVVFVPFFLLWSVTWARQRLGPARVARGLLLWVAGVAVILSLSSYRNHHCFDTLSPFPAHGGLNFFIGNNAQADGIFMSPEGISGSPVAQVTSSIRRAAAEAGHPLTPHQASAFWLKKGLRYLAQHPAAAARLYLAKTGLFWRREEVSLNIDYPLARGLVPLFALPLLSFGAVAPLTLMGLLLAARRRQGRALLPGLYFLAAFLAVVLFFVSDRYRMSGVPVALMFAAAALQSLAVGLARGQYARSALALALTLLFALPINYGFDRFKGDAAAFHFNNLGLAYQRQGELGPAAEHFARAIAEDSRFYVAHNNLGLVLTRQKQYGAARRHFEEALALKPDYDLGWTNLGLLFNEQQRYTEAIASYQKALAINPDSAAAHFNLGIVYEDLDRAADAREHYQRATALDPGYLEAHFNLGKLYLDAGESEKARACFQQVAALDPGTAQADTGFGLYYARSGRLEEAALYLTRAAAKAPDSYTANTNLGLTLSRQGQTAAAIACFKKALAANPAGAEALLYWGKALARSGAAEAAIARFTEALAVRPAYYEAAIACGIELAKLGRLAEAIRQFEHAAAIRPDGLEGRLNLAKAYFLSGDLAAARAEAGALRAIDGQAARALEEQLDAPPQPTGR